MPLTIVRIVMYCRCNAVEIGRRDVNRHLRILCDRVTQEVDLEARERRPHMPSVTLKRTWPHVRRYIIAYSGGYRISRTH